MNACFITTRVIGSISLKNSLVSGNSLGGLCGQGCLNKGTSLFVLLLVTTFW